MNFTTFWASLYTDPIEEGNYVCVYKAISDIV